MWRDYLVVSFVSGCCCGGAPRGRQRAAGTPAGGNRHAAMRAGNARPPPRRRHAWFAAPRSPRLRCLPLPPHAAAPLGTAGAQPVPASGQPVPHGAAGGAAGGRAAPRLPLGHLLRGCGRLWGRVHAGPQVQAVSAALCGSAWGCGLWAPGACVCWEGRARLAGTLFSPPARRLMGDASCGSPPVRQLVQCFPVFLPLASRCAPPCLLRSSTSPRRRPPLPALRRRGGKRYTYTHLQPQLDCMLTEGGGWALDYIGRVEHLREDLQEVLDELERRRAPDVPPVRPPCPARPVPLGRGRAAARPGGAGGCCGAAGCAKQCGPACDASHTGCGVCCSAAGCLREGAGHRQSGGGAPPASPPACGGCQTVAQHPSPLPPADPAGGQRL